MKCNFEEELRSILARATQEDIDALPKDFVAKVVSDAVRQLNLSKQPAQPVFDSMGLDALPPFQSVKRVVG
jgi:hypothetical protein